MFKLLVATTATPHAHIVQDMYSGLESADLRITGSRPNSIPPVAMISNRGVKYIIPFRKPRDDPRNPIQPAECRYIDPHIWRITLANGFKVTVDIKGLDGVVEKMRELGPKLARRGMRKALNKVGDYWVPEVQSRVPVLSGDLKNSIIKRVTTRKDKNGDVGGRVEVGPGYDGGYSQSPGVYGMWVEFGCRNRPNYPVQPFMRPTYDSTKETAVTLFADTLKDVLEELAKGR